MAGDEVFSRSIPPPRLLLLRSPPSLSAPTLALCSLILISLNVGWCFPTGSPRSRTSPTSTSEVSAIDFLTQYGYLPKSGLNSGNLRSEAGFKQAIRMMQKFGNIPMTGELDKATLELMRRPRCGVPDMIGHSERVRRYTIQGQKWPNKNLTYRIAKYARNADRRMVDTQIAKALKVWSDASLLTFTRKFYPKEGDIVVAFEQYGHGDGFSFDGRGTILAHAFFPGEGMGGDAHFDADENWITGVPDQFKDEVSLFSVAAHEFGHSLGLSHSSVPTSLMFPYYQKHLGGDNFVLPNDDRRGIQRLYGTKGSDKWATMEPVRTSNRPSTTEATRGAKPTRPPSLPTVPDMCATSIDAISVIRREVFLFKDRYFWRIHEGNLVTQHPIEINIFWYNLPQNLKRIDAVYERADNKIVFFSGKQFWVFNANYPEDGYPRPIQDLGLPSDVTHIDAAFVWGHNGRTYFFSDHLYWRYDDFEHRVELDYPRHIRMWKGVPHNVDAAFQWTDGQTYFFKGRNFWKFNDRRMSIYNETYNINRIWFKCPSSYEPPDPEKHNADGGTTSSRPHLFAYLLLFLLITVHNRQCFISA